MKNYRSLIIKTSMILFLTIYLGCLYMSDNAKNVSMDTITASMIQNQQVASLQKRDRADLKRFYQIEESATDGYLFYKALSPMSVDEVLIVKAPNRTTAELFLENAESHLESQKRIFEGYGTDQMALLNEAVVESRGNYVFYMCGADSALLRQAFLSQI